MSSRSAPLMFCGRVVAGALAAAFVVTLFAPTLASAASVPPSRVRVTIDPGHGGVYSGASYGGVKEAKLNLAIARYLASELRGRGYDVTLTRTSDRKVYGGGGIRTWEWSSKADRYVYDFWPATDSTDRLRQDLQARCDVANRNGADLFISIHNNAGGTSARGAESYHAPYDPLGSRFAKDLRTGFLAETGAVDRGVHSANFYVLRWTNIPAVLFECGFMSNGTELSRLRSSWYQRRIAEGLADGVDAFVARPVGEPFKRMWGQDRFETAAAVSRAGWASAPAVVLASGEDFADSLVAAPLAASLGGPVLLTNARDLPRPVAEELSRLQPDRMIVVGGPSAVSTATVTAAAKAAGLGNADLAAVTRVSGRDRYESAKRVAALVDPTGSGPVVLASGESFPDALSIAGSASMRGEPILLARGSVVPTATREALFDEGGKQRSTTVVGGAAVVSGDALRGLMYSRLSGSTRYDTNWAVLFSRYGEAARKRPVVASAESFADALVVGPLAARWGRPIVLVGKTTVATRFRPWVYEHRGDTMDVAVVGGPVSVSAYFSAMLDKMRMGSP